MTESRKLGRRNPDIRMLARLPIFPDYTKKLPAPPASVDWYEKVPSFGMMRNDQYGDCVFAAIGHLIQTWTAANGSMVVPSDEDVLAMYSAVTGFDPANPDTDQGALVMDALEYWAKTGMAGHTLGAYARVRVGAPIAVKQAIALCGGVDLGLEMPLAWQGAKDVWDVVRGRDGMPGGWGGHSVMSSAYDAKGLYVVTWGQKVLLTWRAFTRYCVECYVPVSADWADADKAPSGYAYEELAADLDYFRESRRATA